MRRIFGGVPNSKNDGELHRLVHAATMPPYTASSYPYSVPIQFASQRLSTLAQENPQVMQECVKQVKARIKCENSEVSANSICLLDALVHTSTAAVQRQVVQKVLPRVIKIALLKGNYTPPVAQRAKMVVLSWAQAFPLCLEFTAAAQEVAGPVTGAGGGFHPSPAPATSSTAPSRPAPPPPPSHTRAAAGRADADAGNAADQVEIPAARARRTANPPPSNPATGVLMDASAAAALSGSAPDVRPDPTQSRFYQSARRSAEKAAAEERAQRDAQEQTDRAAALIARQDSVERHAPLHESSLPALGASSSDRLRGSSVALTTASYTPAPKIAGGGGNDHEMTIETCAEVSCLFASLLADAPRHQKPNDVLAAVSVRVSTAHVRVQQLLRSSEALPQLHTQQLLEVHQALTSSLDTYASLGAAHTQDTAGCSQPSKPSRGLDIPNVHTMSMCDEADDAPKVAGRLNSAQAQTQEPWPGEALSPDLGASMTTDELMALLVAQNLEQDNATGAAGSGTLPRTHDDKFDDKFDAATTGHAHSNAAASRPAPSAPSVTPSIVSSSCATSSSAAGVGNKGASTHKSRSEVSLLANAYDKINCNLQTAERQVRAGDDDSMIKAGKLNWLHALTKAAKIKLKSEKDGCLCALALQEQVLGMDYMFELQMLGDIEVYLENFLDQPV